MADSCCRCRIFREVVNLSGTARGRFNQEIGSLFDSVVDLPAAERAAYYRKHGISGELSAEVESLLSFDEDSEEVLAGVVAGEASHAASVLQSGLVSDRCGPFQLRKLVG